MKCAEIQEILPAYADDPEVTLAVRRHLSRCADCKTELAAYNSLLDGLADMRAVAVDPPPMLSRALIAIPSNGNKVEQVRTHLARNRRRYAGGVAVAVLGAAGAAVWKTRKSRLVTA